MTKSRLYKKKKGKRANISNSKKNTFHHTFEDLKTVGPLTNTSSRLAIVQK
jgi:hypothetical protein